MKRILMALLGGLLIGAFAADLDKARDKAVANYKKGKGGGMSPASMNPNAKKKK